MKKKVWFPEKTYFHYKTKKLKILSKTVYHRLFTTSDRPNLTEEKKHVFYFFENHHF